MGEVGLPNRYLKSDIQELCCIHELYGMILSHNNACNDQYTSFSYSTQRPLKNVKRRRRVSKFYKQQKNLFITKKLYEYTEAYLQRDQWSVQVIQKTLMNR